MVVVVPKEDAMTAADEAMAAAVVAEEVLAEAAVEVTAAVVPVMAVAPALVVEATAEAVVAPIVNSKCCFKFMTLLPLSFPVDL